MLLLTYPPPFPRNDEPQTPETTSPVAPPPTVPMVACLYSPSDRIYRNRLPFLSLAIFSAYTPIFFCSDQFNNFVF